MSGIVFSTGHKKMNHIFFSLKEFNYESGGDRQLKHYVLTAVIERIKITLQVSKLSIKGQIVNNLGFMGHIISVATT